MGVVYKMAISPSLINLISANASGNKYNSYLSTKDGIGIGNHPYEPCLQDKSHWHKDLNHKVAASSGNGGLQNLEDMCIGIRL